MLNSPSSLPHFMCVNQEEHLTSDQSSSDPHSEGLTQFFLAKRQLLLSYCRILVVVALGRNVCME